MDFFSNFSWIGFVLGGSTAGLLLIAGRHLSQTDIKNLTENALIGRYTYGVISLLVGFSIFLYFSSLLAVIVPLFGICIIAGGIRFLVGRYDIYKAQQKLGQEKLRMLENEHPELTR